MSNGIVSKLFVVAITVGLTLGEVWLIDAGVMSVWGFFLANAMIIGYRVTSLAIRKDIELRSTELKTYWDAVDFWKIVTLIVAVPSMLVTGIFLYIGIDSTIAMMSVLIVSIYLMVVSTLADWQSQIEAK